GEGKNVRDWLHVDDHARALWLLLERGKRGETYNIGGEAERQNIEIVHLILKIMAKLKKTDHALLFSLIQYVKDRPGQDFRYAIDSNQIKRELDWAPFYNLEKGIEETIRWYLGRVMTPTW